MTSERPNADLPDMKECVFTNLRRASRMVSQSYDAALKPVGLKATQFSMLAVLGRRGQMRQSDFADVLGMDGTTLTRNLRPLREAISSMGISTDKVAGDVVDAIRSDRFWIFTHEHTPRAAAVRIADIQAGRNPTDPYGDVGAYSEDGFAKLKTLR